MFEKYVPICFAVKRCEEIRGRKKFQKMFYLSKEAGMPIVEDFSWNNYGPYSRELASELDSLCTMKFLEEKCIEVGVGKEYVYKITDEGTSFLKKSLPEEDQRYIRFGEILEILNKYDSSELEKISSVGFLKREGYDDSYIQTFLEYAKKYTPTNVKTGGDGFSDLLDRFKDL